MEQYIVTVVDLKKSEKLEFTIEADEAETTENIILWIEINGVKLSASDYNYLSAYQQLRDKVLNLGFGIQCNGSRLNAIQSGMMGANEKIYLVDIGKSTTNNDIVSLYDYAEIDSFPNTLEQADFFRKWKDLHPSSGT